MTHYISPDFIKVFGAVQALANAYKPKLITNASAVNPAQVRAETRKGRQYLVIPTVAIRAGVLNGEYVPADEIEKFALAWNGRPVPLGHPKDQGGHVSANTPDLWDATPAFFWNAKAQSGKLSGEIWFDVAKAKQIGGLAVQAEAQLRAGQPMEVSTAYFRDLAPGAGTFNGKPFNGTARNLRPDHIALLIDEPGACSWADGCGAGRLL